jgi:exoribonuclease R
MLLANMAVAHKINSVFPEASLLRCHPPPLQKGLDRFLELAKKIGYEFDASSAGSLHESFERIPDPVICGF